jgi:hypothetical protein
MLRRMHRVEEVLEGLSILHRIDHEEIGGFQQQSTTVTTPPSLVCPPPSLQPL